MWTTTKPKRPGVYMVRGFEVGVPRERQREAAVEVRKRGRGLVCNLHAKNSGDLDDGYDWSPVPNMAPDFEWLGPLTPNTSVTGGSAA